MLCAERVPDMKTDDLEELERIVIGLSRAGTEMGRIDEEISKIGPPASQALGGRLRALQVEKKALRRNLRELGDARTPNAGRRKRSAERLIEHIRNEENELRHEAGFLKRAPATSSEWVVRGAMGLVGFFGKGWRRLLRGRHPLGTSAFVNHSCRDLFGRDDVRCAVSHRRSSSPEQGRRA